MGKAALFIVFSASLAGATLLYTSQQNDVRTSVRQSEYDADVLAREIARSAYNAAVSDVNRQGTDFEAALQAIGTRVTSGCATGAPVCYRRVGQMQGGRFVVEAMRSGGNGIDLYAAGYYPFSTTGEDGRPTRAEKEHAINELYPLTMLQVDPRGEGGLLRIQFVDSQAGYCSAIFLKRTLPGVAANLQPPIQMVYAPGKNRNGDRNVGFEVELEPGTRMNFGIGVDNNCNSGGSHPTSRPDLRMNAASQLRAGANGPARLAALMAGYRYLESDWAWTHWALDAQALDEGRTEEGPWAMVEIDPTNPQRWRIAFEDIHDWNLAPGHRDYDNPNKSLAGLKRFGYDWVGSFDRPGNDGVGNGWTDVRSYRITPSANGRSYTVTEVAGSDGFHDLREGSLDLGDQVIFVEVIPHQTASR